MAFHGKKIFCDRVFQTPYNINNHVSQDTKRVLLRFHHQEVPFNNFFLSLLRNEGILVAVCVLKGLHNLISSYRVRPINRNVLN